jgi:hypothetical protein
MTPEAVPHAVIADHERDLDQATGLSIQVFAFSNSSMEVGKQLASVQVDGACAQGAYAGTASVQTEATMSAWVVAKLNNGGKAALTGVTLDVVYDSDGAMH